MAHHRTPRGTAENAKPSIEAVRRVCAEMRNSERLCDCGKHGQQPCRSAVAKAEGRA